MLAEARGYHLSLVLAHQHLDQLPRDTQLALSANARNKIFFACSPEDARGAGPAHRPRTRPTHDLAHLPAYRAAARLVVDSRTTAAFTLATHTARPVVGERTAIRRAVARSDAPASSALAELAGRSRRTPPRRPS